MSYGDQEADCMRMRLCVLQRAIPDGYAVLVKKDTLAIIRPEDVRTTFYLQSEDEGKVFDWLKEGAELLAKAQPHKQ